MAGQDVKGDMVAPSPANKQPVSTVSCSAAQPASHLRMRRTAQLHLTQGDAIQLQQGSVLLPCHPGMCSSGEGSGAGSRAGNCSAGQRPPAGACGCLCPPAELGHPGRHQPVDDLLRGPHHVQEPAAPGLWQAAGTRRLSRQLPLSCRVSEVLSAATLLACTFVDCTLSGVCQWLLALKLSCAIAEQAVSSVLHAANRRLGDCAGDAVLQRHRRAEAAAVFPGWECYCISHIVLLPPADLQQLQAMPPAMLAIGSGCILMRMDACRRGTRGITRKLAGR